MTEAQNIARLTRQMEAATAEGDNEHADFIWGIICKLQAKYRSRGVFVI
jgi:hypothetical protein